LVPGPTWTFGPKGGKLGGGGGQARLEVPNQKKKNIPGRGGRAGLKNWGTGAGGLGGGRPGTPRDGLPNPAFSLVPFGTTGKVHHFQVRQTHVSCFRALKASFVAELPCWASSPILPGGLDHGFSGAGHRGVELIGGWPGSKAGGDNPLLCLPTGKFGEVPEGRVRRRELFKETGMKSWINLNTCPMNRGAGRGPRQGGGVGVGGGGGGVVGGGGGFLAGVRGDSLYVRSLA